MGGFGELSEIGYRSATDRQRAARAVQKREVGARRTQSSRRARESSLGQKGSLKGVSRGLLSCPALSRAPRADQGVGQVAVGALRGLKRLWYA